MKLEILDFIKKNDAFLNPAKPFENTLKNYTKFDNREISSIENKRNKKEVFKNVIGYELISINKEDNSNESLINTSKNIALTWHENLLKIFSEFCNITLNLKYITQNGKLSCKLFITIIENNEPDLQKKSNQIANEISSFFPSLISDKISPYLFQELNINNLSWGNNSKDYYHLFYRQPKTISSDYTGFGFNNIYETPDNNIILYLPVDSQPLEYDFEFFKAMLNQKEFVELDVQLIPQSLTEDEINIINRMIKKIKNNINLSEEEKNKINDNLQAFLNNKSKYFVTVLLRSKNLIIGEHLNTGIKNYFFGKKSNVNHHEISFNNSNIFINNDKSNLTGIFPFCYSIDDVLQVFRFPLPGNVIFPGFNQKSSGFFTLPENLDNTSILIGEKKINNNSKEIRISNQSLSKHLFVSGQTGSGKSTLLKTMIFDCIQKNYGFTLVDPHGDLYDEIIPLITPEKSEKLKIINVTKPEESYGINPLVFNKEFPQGKSLVINELIRIFGSIYDLKSVGGPMFESFFKNGLLLIMDDNVEEVKGKLSLVNFVEVFINEDYRNDLLSICKNYSVVKFFRTSDKMSGDYSFANFSLYITSKLTRFVEDFYLSPIITSEKNLDFRNLIDNNEILLIKLDKGLIGTDNTSLLGQIIISQIYMAGLSRTTIRKEERKPHYIFIDEFQNFVKSDIGNALSEVRKYGLNLILANQTLGQLDQQLVDSIFGNVGSKIFFRPGINDYEKIKHYISPEFSRSEVLNLPNFNCICRLLIDNVPSNPFVFETIK